MSKIRLDVLLVEKGLADSRAKAQALIMAGQVRVADQVALKPSITVQPDSALTVDSGPKFVSRGGEKLEGALDAFQIDVRGFVCADVGASTGGFTDCLLQRGAVKVYAIDVGKGILHWKLRNDSRVVVMEETNVRFVEALPEKIDFVSIDASFISLKTILPVVQKWKPNQIVALIKPQFEAGRKEVSRGDGVIRDAQIHRQVALDISQFAQAQGWGILGLVRSPLTGPKGNVEFLLWLENRPNGAAAEEFVEAAIPTSESK
ncbi:MAG: TlyA family RNA methyltransferase [Anaerolineales bacterium]|nr:TlyA family RNA methyltransferase [Anaerolineales bacterium]